MTNFKGLTFAKKIGGRETLLEIGILGSATGLSPVSASSREMVSNHLIRLLSKRVSGFASKTTYQVTMEMDKKMRCALPMIQT